MKREIQRADPYPDKILKLIPSEIIAVLLAIVGYVQGQSITLGGMDITRWFMWGVFAVLLILTPMYLWKLQEVSEIPQLAFSTLAFAVWAYAIGGPFQVEGWHQPQIASTLLALYTLFVPLVLGKDSGPARSTAWARMP